MREAARGGLCYLLGFACPLHYESCIAHFMASVLEQIITGWRGGETGERRGREGGRGRNEREGEELGEREGGTGKEREEQGERGRNWVREGGTG